MLVFVFLAFGIVSVCTLPLLVASVPRGMQEVGLCAEVEACFFEEVEEARKGECYLADAWYEFADCIAADSCTIVGCDFGEGFYIEDK